MRKYIIYLTILSLFGCKKDLEVIVPDNQNVIYKNYQLPSYDLQKSNIHVDIMDLRKKVGHDNIIGVGSTVLVFNKNNEILLNLRIFSTLFNYLNLS